MDALKRIWPEWQIIDVLGQGTFGSVLKAKRTLAGYDDIYSAIKIVTIPRNPQDVRVMMSSGMSYQDVYTYYQDIVNHMMAEIAIMQSLKGVNEIVSIEDFMIIEEPGEMKWRIYIRMELLAGLETYMRTNDERMVIKLACDVCRGLMRCEEKAIIHRDIKPANILVDEYGTFKIADFGIARQIGDATGASTQAGTENYMAPEVYRGEHYNQTVDLYSLGLMMYQFLNDGRLPFMPSYPETLRVSDYQAARSLRMQGAALPAPAHASDSLSRIILKACAYNPQARYQSAREMLAALTREPQREDGVTSSGKEKAPLWVIPVIMAIVAAVFIGAVVLFKGTRQKTRYEVDLLYDVSVAYTTQSDGTLTIDEPKCEFISEYQADDPEIKAFIETIDKSNYSFSATSSLHEGDTIIVYVHVEQDVLTRYHITLPRTSRELTVETRSGS